ncbi:MAG: PTS sugar transporter subunit IIC [FCB group bacterium]|nr:PTS sugar transporter subunit IIC [FCB group bacterium]
MPPSELIIIAVLGGIIALDKSSFMMFISEPLIICAAAGAYIGELEQGVMIGMLWQIVWMGELPIGAVKVPDGSTGALLSAWIYLNLNDKFPQQHNILLSLSILAGILGAYFGGGFIRDKRRFHSHYMSIADGFAMGSRPKGVESVYMIGVMEQFAFGAVFTCLVYVIFSFLASWTLSLIPFFWDGLFKYVLTGSWGLLAAILVNQFLHRKTYAAMLLGIAAGVIFMVLL